MGGWAAGGQLRHPADTRVSSSLSEGSDYALDSGRVCVCQCSAQFQVSHVICTLGVCVGVCQHVCVCSKCICGVTYNPVLCLLVQCKYIFIKSQLTPIPFLHHNTHTHPDGLHILILFIVTVFF